MFLTIETERIALVVASSFYILGYSTLFGPVTGRWQRSSTYLGLLSIGLLVNGLAIVIRWLRLGHGPFGNLYEILLSNVCSLTLAVTLFVWFFPRLLRTVRAALPILMVLLVWLLITEPRDSFLPATYQTIWLYVHLLFGKLFLGCLLISTALAGVALYHRDQFALEELSFRFAAVALIFDSSMLIVGAVWAQDAWGRYWAWDPLETWAFLTWLALVLMLHLRSLTGVPRRLPLLLTIGVFVLAFLTFFGVPFFSLAPHKGAI